VRIAIDTNRMSISRKAFPKHWTGSGARTGENEANLVRFLDSRRVDLMFADEATTHHYAGLFHQLRRQGTPIPTNDLWIAALVVQHELHLFARDAHFDHLPQIPRL
jgi:tRNA(fMet)-specific endonuclease VapC